MGLLDIFQPTNGWAANAPGGFGAQPSQFTQWVRANPYALQAAGQGLQGFFGGMSGASNLHDALTGATAGLNKANTPAYLQLQLQKRQQDKEAADAKAQQNATVAWIQKNAPKYYGAVQAGVISPADAYKAALSEQQPQGPIKASQGDVFLDPKTMQPLYSVPKDQGPYTLGPNETRFGVDNKPIATGQPAANTMSAPTGYRFGQNGNLEFIPGGPADPSTAGKTTEATRRNQQLATVIVPELKSLVGDGQKPGTFDALANGWDQAKGMVPGVGNFMTSPEYQQAQNSMRTIVASYLYSVSGATANPGEVENQVSVLTPRPGDNPQTVAAKKARLIEMVKAVVAAASGTPIAVDASQLPQNATQPSAPPQGIDPGIWQYMTPEEKALWQN